VNNAAHEGEFPTLRQTMVLMALKQLDDFSLLF
jgi:hypothetical protein